MTILPRNAFYMLALVLQGCATIVNGPKQDIGISSTPSSASVWVDGTSIGYTPLIVGLTRESSHTVRIELDGYEPFQVGLSKKVSGWVAGNLAVGGIAGFVVDAVTGSMYCLYPDQIHAILVKQGQNMTLEEGQLYCAKVMHPEPDWQKVGDLTPQQGQDTAANASQ